MLRKRTGPQGSCSSPFISSVPSVHGIRKGRFCAHMCAGSGGVLDALDIKTFSNVPYYVTYQHSLRRAKVPLFTELSLLGSGGIC